MKGAVTIFSIPEIDMYKFDSSKGGDEWTIKFFGDMAQYLISVNYKDMRFVSEIPADSPLEVGFYNLLCYLTDEKSSEIAG